MGAYATIFIFNGLPPPPPPLPTKAISGHGENKIRKINPFFDFLLQVFFHESSSPKPEHNVRAISIFFQKFMVHHPDKTQQQQQAILEKIETSLMEHSGTFQHMIHVNIYLSKICQGRQGSRN